MPAPITTLDVLRELDIGERTLMRLMQRDPSLKPPRFGVAFLWTPIAIARVRRALAKDRAGKK